MLGSGSNFGVIPTSSDGLILGIDKLACRLRTVKGADGPAMLLDQALQDAGYGDDDALRTSRRGKSEKKSGRVGSFRITQPPRLHAGYSANSNHLMLERIHGDEWKSRHRERDFAGKKNFLPWEHFSPQTFLEQRDMIVDTLKKICTDLEHLCRQRQFSSGKIAFRFVNVEIYTDLRIGFSEAERFIDAVANRMKEISFEVHESRGTQGSDFREVWFETNYFRIKCYRKSGDRIRFEVKFKQAHINKTKIIDYRDLLDRLAEDARELIATLMVAPSEHAVLTLFEAVRTFVEAFGNKKYFGELLDRVIAGRGYIRASSAESRSMRDGVFNARLIFSPLGSCRYRLNPAFHALYLLGLSETMPRESPLGSDQDGADVLCMGGVKL